MKKSAEIKAKIETLKNEAKALTKASEINAKIDEIEDLKAQLIVVEMEEADEQAEIENKIDKGKVVPVDNTIEIDNSKKYENAFYNMLAGKPINVEDRQLLVEVNNALSSDNGEDGGYLIPVDQRTEIKELKRQMKSLEELVNVEPVNTKTGSRNIEKDAEYTPFAEFTETDDIGETDSPQFVNISYDIKDRGGILPVPNNLLKDNKANIKAHLNKWLAKKQVATRNKLIVDILNLLPKTAITAIDDIKDIINVQLDPSISDMSVAVTNQDSFNKLDKMKDSDGNYLLQKDPTEPTRKLLAGKIPIKVYSNKTIKTRDDSGTKKAPIIIGSLKEAITLFDREQLSLLATAIGGTAFGKNRTEIRAITREDVKKVDEDAVVFGEITIG
ncbi:phage major capsid protein [Vallitalea sediminicola]